MESDSVRAMGESTLVDLWIEGKFRAITISRQAIETYLQLAPGDAASMSENDRREFVRLHLGLVVRAATALLHAKPSAETIVIEAGQLGGKPQDSAGEQRSTGDRRKADRRKVNLGPPGGVERRGR
ncbi:MAG TPA: hypothetical protein VHS33_00545 [Sphingomicrobium sp.]|jgi:hypothetical protein|nr:hypothetical protein [Sphingomicrobium sp.]